MYAAGAGGKPTCSNGCCVFDREQMETFAHSFAVSVMARNHRFLRAYSHVRQLRLGSLHIDRNAISPECIYWCQYIFKLQNVCIFLKFNLSKMRTQSHGIYLNSSCAQKVHAASSSAFEQSLILSHLKRV